MDMTICLSDETLVMIEGRVSGSRLVYQAAGINFYQEGVSKYHHDDCVPNMVMNACLERHIPVVSLRRVKAVNAGKKPIDTKTRNMFGGLK